MLKIVRSKFIAISLIFSFILFYSPHLFAAKVIGKGNLVGYVYGEDETTPVEGAVVKMRNISTSSVYESEKSDKQGSFKLEGIDEGLYVVGISTKERDFSGENLIGIKANETGKVSFALKPQQVVRVKKGNKGLWQRGIGTLGFLQNPWVIAGLVAAAIAIPLVIIMLTEEEPEASPFR